jgi:hypothetical protein
MKRLFPTLALVLLLSGCAAHVIHPGSANKFDSDAYDSVLIAHSVIETTKTDLANNAFPASIAGNVKTALNDLIKAYDVADKAYIAYHNAALAGTATAAQSTAVTNSLTTVNTSTTALTAAKVGKPVAELGCPAGTIKMQVLNGDLETTHYACSILIGAN